MKPPADPAIYLGQTFFKLTVVEKSPRPRHWVCKCSCPAGTTTTVRADSLQQGRTRSCGCLRITHGATKGGKPSPTFNTWRSMIARCTNPKDKSFKSHGGRGITVCTRWKIFENFQDDMGSRPKRRTLDRIDNEGSYNKDNCQWCTPAEQAQNRRSTRRITYGSTSRTLKGWAEYLSESTGKKWSLKTLEYILQFLTLEQIMVSLHPCQRKPSELIAEAARRSEQAKREEQARQQSKAGEENRIRIAREEAEYALNPRCEQPQPIYFPPPPPVTRRRLAKPPAIN
jgi:hypothetical protein